MTESGEVTFGGTNISYQVRRSARRRKTLQITLDPEAKRVLKSWLVAEYARPVLASIKGSRIDAEKARKLADSSAVELTSISARGCGKESEVRVEVTVAGRTPPDGRSVRYFRMSYSLLGWSLEHESNAFFYHLTLCGG